MAFAADYFSGFLDKARKHGAYTSLDAMKLFAIVNMTADHIGYYFCPHQLWWRAIGRITFPVWFFLVGYSRSRGLSRELWIYAVLLFVDRPFIGFQLFPVNALFSIILCRIFLNYCSERNWLPNRLPVLITICVLLTPFTAPLFEYGSIAFLYALFGRMVVEKRKEYFPLLFGVCYVDFIFWQFAWFPFTLWQGLYVVIGTFGVVWWLSRFTNDVIWPQWEQSRFKIFITLLSRNTMPYYFYHRMIFEMIAAFTIGHGLHFALHI